VIIAVDLRADSALPMHDAQKFLSSGSWRDEKFEAISQIITVEMFVE
jgi:hypothetical protein